MAEEKSTLDRNFRTWKPFLAENLQPPGVYYVALQAENIQYKIVALVTSISATLAGWAGY